METSNDGFLDALVRHQIGLLRTSARTQKEIARLLNDTEAAIAAAIVLRLGRLAEGNGTDIRNPEVVTRLNNLQKKIKEIRASAFSKSLLLWDSELRELMSDEVDFLSMSLETVLPVVYLAKRPDLRVLKSLVTSDPLRGPGPELQTLRKWVKKLAVDDVGRIMGQIKAGLIEGSTSSEIAKRVVGTARLRGTDGVTESTRRAVKVFTLTAMNHFAHKAKKSWYEDNSDVFSREDYLAILDARTTVICRALDGRVFEVGKGPYPPMHPFCRSIRVGVISRQALATGQMKPNTKKMVLNEFTRRKGISPVTRRRDLPLGSRREFDRYAKARVEEIIGRASTTTSYSNWLKRQPVEVQSDILGVTKAKLFRRGGLTLDRFVDERGREYTLKELAIRDRQAFKQAGLDPVSFKLKQAA